MSAVPPMYRLPKLVNIPQQVDLPDCMYMMQPLNQFSSKDLASSYYGSTCSGAAVTQGRLADVAALEARQENVLQRLRDVKQQLDVLQSTKFASLSPSKSNSITAIGAAAKASPFKTGTVHDLVISANPKKPPYFLVLLRKLMKETGYPVYSVDHLHSSVSMVEAGLRKTFEDKPLGERSQHKLAFTVHWKDVQMPTLMVNPLRQTIISGGTNIARYISRLFPLTSNYNYEATSTFTDIAETDNILDQLSKQITSSNNKERQGALRQLNARLGKKSWLVGNECGIADVVLWSMVKQEGLDKGAPANVDKWYKSLDAKAGIVSGVQGQMAQHQKTTVNDTKPTQKTNQKNTRSTEKTNQKAPAKDTKSTQKTKSVANTEKSVNVGNSKFIDRKDLEKHLKWLNISYQIKDHEEVFTVNELMKHVALMPGLHMKNLFLKDKKKNLYLLSVRHNAEVKLNEVGKQIGVKDLRFGDEAVMYDTLGVKQGCVTAFALLNDKNKQVNFLLDSEALSDSHPFVNFHPITNAATLGISPQDLKKFLNSTGHEPVLLKFD